MLAELFEEHRLPSVIVGEDLKVRAANAAAARLMRASDKEGGIGSPISSWIPVDLLTDKLEHASSIGSWVPLRSRIAFGADGPECDILLRRLRRSGPEPLFWLLISVSSQNRTAFRQLREEIASAQARAAAEIVLRNQLVEANDKLKSFAYRAAHDINGPLRRIEQCLKMQNMVRQAETVNPRLLEIAASSAASLSALVEDLLAYSASGRGSAEFEMVDLAALVQGMETLLDTSGCDPGWLALGDLPKVMGDPPQIASIVQNLLDNAIKYRDPARPLRVTVSSQTTKAGSRLVFEDNGLGFEAQFADRLFEPFFRAHSDIPGSGIGRASCAEFVANHGWTIAASGEAGKGARFEIIIPDEGVSDSARRLAEPAAGPQARGGPIALNG